MSHLVESLCKGAQNAMVHSLSVALDMGVSDVKNALWYDGRLLSMRFIRYVKSFPANSLQLELLDELHDVLFISHGSVNSLMNCFIEQTPASSL
jgi:hypothetical protein